MDWYCKAVLTAMTVATVLVVADKISGRGAGLLAGLPVITVPAMVAMAQAQGMDFVARSVSGSAAVCVMAPGLAITFVVLARRHGMALSLAGAAVIGGLAVSAMQAVDGRPLLALALAAVFCIVAKSWMGWMGAACGAPCAGPCAAGQRLLSAATAATSSPVQGAAGPAAQATAPRRLTGEPWLTAAIAGAVVAAVLLLAPQLGPYWSGVLSSLPIILVLSLLRLQHVAGVAALPAFVEGYVVGVLAKAVFLCCFALTVAAWGPANAGVFAALAGLIAAWTLSHAAAGSDRAAAARAARPVLPALPALPVGPGADHPRCSHGC